MSNITNKIIKFVKLLNLIKKENSVWQKKNGNLIFENKKNQVLAEQELLADLKRRKLQLDHELTLLKTKQTTQIAMFKTKCKQDIDDYKQYLASLDHLKQSIQNSYKHLPESVAFTIHHHAKYLLHKMWETEDFEQKLKMEKKLIEFMTTVQEDTSDSCNEREIGGLPEKTLRLIENL